MREDISETVLDRVPPSAGLTPLRASVSCDEDNPALTLCRRLGPGPFALILVFASDATGNLSAVLSRVQTHYPQAELAGCTTAGELCEDGYAENHIVAIGFPPGGFAVETVLIDPLDAVESRVVISQLQRARQTLLRRAGDFPHELGILLVDGLSGREEFLISSLAGGLGPVPVVGGSAGDDRKFRRTRVFAEGGIHERAAVLCLLRARVPLRTFSFNSTSPSRTQMVVTEADPANRAILKINDEPAAAEYARLIGVPVESLGAQVFATRPVLVRAGRRHHVRSIQHVGPEHSLVFFGAVAEGMVLTLSEDNDIAAHLERELRGLSRDAEPGLILGFDCIFRRIDAEARQKTGEVSSILRRHRVAGFSTYGEQYGSMHVNQTFTGVAFYDPGTTP